MRFVTTGLDILFSLYIWKGPFVTAVSRAYEILGIYIDSLIQHFSELL